MTGRTLFLDERNDEAETFLSEFTFSSFLLSMLSCLTLDAECFICLDTVQFTTHHCVILGFWDDFKAAFDSI